MRKAPPRELRTNKQSMEDKQNMAKEQNTERTERTERTEQTTVERVQEQIRSLRGKKRTDLETIRAKQEETRAQIAEAETAIKDATEYMNLEAYEGAKAEKRKAQTALEMYNSRFAQIQAQELITEAESDAIINSLLEYENELAESFRAKASEPLKELAGLLKEYKAAIEETERTIREWETTIHANYSTRGRTLYYNEFTGKHTDRSPRPVLVHPTGFEGCTEAVILSEYLRKAAGLIS